MTPYKKDWGDLCREIVGQMMPHLTWQADKTQILPFYSFAAVQRDYLITDAVKPAVQT